MDHYTDRIDHYTTLKHWLRAKWRNIPDEQVMMMLQAANALESLQLDNHNLRRELSRCQSHAADPVEAAPSLSPCRLS